MKTMDIKYSSASIIARSSFYVVVYFFKDFVKVLLKNPITFLSWCIVAPIALLKASVSNINELDMLSVDNKTWFIMSLKMSWIISWLHWFYKKFTFLWVFSFIDEIWLLSLAIKGRTQFIKPRKQRSS